MLLAAAVGTSAGLALENARLHLDILEKQRIEQEIATAWSIQEGFLVKDWNNSDPRFDVYGETVPAKTVGGDFYDFLQPAKDTVDVLIGDVSGKGVPAALTMAQLLAEFRIHARTLASPAEVMRTLNRGLCYRSRHGLFCTLCLLRIDLASGTARLVNAGHGPVLRIGAKGTSTFGDASGPPVGILDDSDWTEETVALPPGELLLLHTDGITEARKARREGEAPTELGEEGVARVAGRHTAANARQLVEGVQSAVRDH
jgi:serine phosphatase RsbU (regulator of sigma subunit)